ncbi:MAG: monofunctional biosynthetic peptidoglycan transglycosylase [Pseudolabrys sp.]
MQNIPWRRVLRLAAIAAVGLIVLPYLLTPLYSFGRPVSTMMVWRWATFQRVERQWVPLERVAPVLARSVIVAEDGRFCTHSGVDFQELQEVLADAEGLEDLGDLRGGSTITQQLAKNLFLWQGRSYVRKALEFPLALWVNLVLSKRRILEIYLNVAEWGPDGTFGIEASSRRAFGKPARSLGAQEAALLAAMLPNPVRRDAKKPGRGLRRLAGVYVARARQAGGADDCLHLNP